MYRGRRRTRTERADLERGDHASRLQRRRLLEETDEVRAGDDPGHNSAHDASFSIALLSEQTAHTLDHSQTVNVVSVSDVGERVRNVQERRLRRRR